MTRNEFIAETAARFAVNEAIDASVRRASDLAGYLALEGVAPWQTPPAPALTDAARRVVEAAVAYCEWLGEPSLSAAGKDFASAIRAYKESAK